jgi:peptidoglycan/LPS O-acetylase OafA/YrhL
MCRSGIGEIEPFWRDTWVRIASSTGVKNIVAKPCRSRRTARQKESMDKDELSGRSRLDHLDAIRGLAAMAVCVFHFTHGAKLLPPNAVLNVLPKYGYLGVEVFFILSGFVIPWMLWKTDYRLNGFGRFFAKRMVRLYPPFLVANALVYLLFFASRASPLFAGSREPIDYSAMAFSFLLDATYLTGILERPWISVVAWTLAIEVQFYIVAGILMGFMVRFPAWATALALALLAISGSVLTDDRFVFRYLPFFALGWSGAFFTRHKQSWYPWLAASVSAGIILWTSSGLQLGLALAALGVIVFWKWAVPGWLLALGTISYSLYLVHVPIGGRVVNLGLRFAKSGTMEVVPVIVAGIVLSVAASAVFWRYVEYPAQQWSRKLFRGN